MSRLWWRAVYVQPLSGVTVLEMVQQTETIWYCASCILCMSTYAYMLQVDTFSKQDARVSKRHYQTKSANLCQRTLCLTSCFTAYAGPVSASLNPRESHLGLGRDDNNFMVLEHLPG